MINVTEDLGNWMYGIATSLNWRRLWEAHVWEVVMGELVLDVNLRSLLHIQVKQLTEWLNI